MGARIWCSANVVRHYLVVLAVGDETADALIAILKGQIAKMSIWPVLRKAKKMIWVPSFQHSNKAKICDYITSGEKQSATLLVDGRDF